MIICPIYSIVRSLPNNSIETPPSKRKKQLMKDSMRSNAPKKEGLRSIKPNNLEQASIGNSMKANPASSSSNKSPKCNKKEGKFSFRKFYLPFFLRVLYHLLIYIKFKATSHILKDF